MWGGAIDRRAEIQPSISDYYGLRTRDAFVGVLFAIGWFLFTYRGYERKDDIAGNLACVFALAVALFPKLGTPWEKGIHFTAATALFLVLAYYSLFLFTKSSGSPTREKGIRNRVYVICGVGIAICIVLTGLSLLLDLENTPLMGRLHASRTGLDPCALAAGHRPHMATVMLDSWGGRRPDPTGRRPPGRGFSMASCRYA